MGHKRCITPATMLFSSLHVRVYQVWTYNDATSICESTVSPTPLSLITRIQASVILRGKDLAKVADLHVRSTSSRCVEHFVQREKEGAWFRPLSDFGQQSIYSRVYSKCLLIIADSDDNNNRISPKSPTQCLFVYFS